MNQLAVQGPTEPIPAPQSESAAVLSIIERAARDPSVDIDKLKQLMEMREKVEMQAAERAFNTAMKAAQAEMRPVSADAENPQTRSRYATYAKLDRALRPIYTKHGFALSFDEADSPKPDHIRVLCYVTHDGGFTRTYRKDMPADGKGAKGGDVMTKTHATGAAASYGSRYLLKGIFNVAVGEDDRDGNEPAGVISQEQLEELIRLADSIDADKAAFCKYFGIAGLADLPAKQYDRAVAAFKKRGAK
jgi:hypothetical protein